jgi:general secretion pathway protein G
VLGVTLLEMLIAVALVGLLTAVAVPTYRQSSEKSKIMTAKRDILEISIALDKYFLATNRYPNSLADIGQARTDPWGTPYQYLPMEGAKIGQKRKDKSLHPLNSDYDLYSNGPDGNSQTPLTASASRDDIIRANNGGFIGVAQDY